MGRANVALPFFSLKSLCSAPVDYPVGLVIQIKTPEGFPGHSATAHNVTAAGKLLNKASSLTPSIMKRFLCQICLNYMEEITSLIKVQISYFF